MVLPRRRDKWQAVEAATYRVFVSRKLADFTGAQVGLDADKDGKKDAAKVLNSSNRNILMLI